VVPVALVPVTSPVEVPPSPHLIVHPMPSEESHMVSVLTGKPGADSVATVLWTWPRAFAVSIVPMTVSGQGTWAEG
jgi:hypothetical protein